MRQADVNAQMLPWGDREIARFMFRQALFVRRGLPEPQAERLADRLALRDQQRDDRRMCIECSHLQASGGCFAATHGWLPGTSRRHEPAPVILQRCEQFQWVMP